MSPPRVCLYFGGERQFVGRYTGIGAAHRNHVQALRSLGVEVTTDPHDEWDLLHTYWFHPATLFWIRRARERGLPVICHAHTTPEEFACAAGGRWIYRPARRYLVSVYNRGDLVLAPTDHTREVLLRHGVTPPIEVVTNGVDLSRFDPDPGRRDRVRAELGLTGTVVFNVAQAVERKGVQDFLAAARRLPDLQFVWFGKTYPLRLWERPLFLDRPCNARFTGFVPRIVDAYAAGDIFFFPSFEENQGIAVLEAAASGKPLVLRDLPAYRGTFIPGAARSASDLNGFCRQLRFLADHLEARQQLGHLARQAAEGHDLRQVGSRLRAIYERVWRRSGEPIAA